ncbi:hypothetical protein ABIA71_003642 [Stenotrophomonas sp. 2619]|uniref:antiviral RADAR system adenosine triphosphatase RdrA n=1 Tax=Stenotrophomonas sp. 2619 TaxID=3156316 RepID=UPI003394BF4B
MAEQQSRIHDHIYLPLDQGERSGHLSVNQLLPRTVYEKLTKMISDSLQVGELNSPDTQQTNFQRERGHTTIFLDGNRGTGKTTVIVNLRQYINSDEVRRLYPSVSDFVHVLEPIDPSQLEDGDDLFLNVVVAAVLSDRKILEGRDSQPDGWQALHNSLQALGSALAGKETQGEGVGLDRLRAFIGTQELVSAVHEFFTKAAHLVGKKLLVLPIDDVDTTLHRAFENLEVVRRYLASPAVLPIVCGDLSLYREVTWRDAFRRLTIDTSHQSEQAKPIAVELAHEYLRKILPLHRRLRMSDVGELLSNHNIILGPENHRAGLGRLSLPEMDSWLIAVLAGPVNGQENSRLKIPITTVRALSQILSRVKHEIPSLEEAFFGESQSTPQTELMRRISLQGKRRSSPKHPRQAEPASSNKGEQLSLSRWTAALLDHFTFEPSAGAVCLVLLALRDWQSNEKASVLDTPLFQPQNQIECQELRYIETRSPLNWSMELEGRLPDSWLESIPYESILPFATPEAGRAVVPLNWEIETSSNIDAQDAAIAHLLVNLITHHNFYSSSKRSTLISSGRILELIVTSLVRDVTADDIDRILRAPPFHSAPKVAATKELKIPIHEIDTAEQDVDDETSFIRGQRGGAHSDSDMEGAVNFLCTKINSWRSSSNANKLAASPWLIYCALNKTLNQTPFFTRQLGINEQPKSEALVDVVASGLSTFNSFWAALASFEKGPLFGLSIEVSNVNIVNRKGDFYKTNLYTQNIKPLLDATEVPGSVDPERFISYTSTLSSHPLGSALQNLFSHSSEAALMPLDLRSTADGRAALINALGLSENVKRITVAMVKNALLRNAPRGFTPRRFGESILKKIENRYPTLGQLNVLRRAIQHYSTTEAAMGAR